MITRPVYATREEIKSALDVQQTARNNTEIDRQLQASTDMVSGGMHRRFYPQQMARYWDWPNYQYAYPWRVWFDEWDLADPTSATVTSGGVLLPANTIKWGRPSNGAQAPYTYLELDRSSSSVFGHGATPQRDITITGPWGYSNDEIPAGTLAGNLNSTDTSINPGIPLYRGVGSILRIDTERLIVSDRTTVTTGTTIQGNLTLSANANLVPVLDATQYTTGETLLVDAEYMYILDTAGTNLVVKRAWNGSALAAHTSGATIYAARQLTVIRGALGTTAASHTAGTPIAEHDAPAAIRQLSIAQTVVNLVQTKAGYPSAAGRRPPQSTTQTAPITAASDLDDLWRRADPYRRQGRMRTV